MHGPTVIFWANLTPSSLKEPLRSLALNTTATLPPRPGRDWWRINFSRVEWYTAGFTLYMVTIIEIYSIKPAV